MARTVRGDAPAARTPNCTEPGLAPISVTSGGDFWHFITRVPLVPSGTYDEDWNELNASQRPARLSVGVVGAGRVGTTLGAALSLAGHRVVAATGVSDASRRRAADRLPAVPILAPQEGG